MRDISEDFRRPWWWSRKRDVFWHAQDAGLRVDLSSQGRALRNFRGRHHGKWEDVFTGERFETLEDVTCRLCGMSRDPDYADACIGWLGPEKFTAEEWPLRNVCCGHGLEVPYILTLDERTYGGLAARRIMWGNRYREIASWHRKLRRKTRGGA